MADGFNIYTQLCELHANYCLTCHEFGSAGLLEYSESRSHSIAGEPKCAEVPRRDCRTLSDWHHCWQWRQVLAGRDSVGMRCSAWYACPLAVASCVLTLSMQMACFEITACLGIVCLWVVSKSSAHLCG